MYHGHLQLYCCCIALLCLLSLSDGGGRGARNVPFFLQASDFRDSSVVVGPLGEAKHTFRNLLWKSSISGQGGSFNGIPRCGTCAVVGSAGSLLARTVGAEIDAHDCVFRMNNAFTVHFAKHVGRRHTVHVWAMPHVQHFEDDEVAVRQRELANFARIASNLTVLVAREGQTVDRALELNQSGNLPLERLRMLHPKQVAELCGRILQCNDEKWPSTGIIAIHLAQRLCKKPPEVYGFDANSVPFHYYDPAADALCDAVQQGRLRGQGLGNERPAHNWELEQHLLQTWHAENSIVLWNASFTPHPDVSGCTPVDTFELTGEFVHNLFTGSYKVQQYLINGKALYERIDERGLAYTTLLVWTNCAMFSGTFGAWLIVPFSRVVAIQRETPGKYYDCEGFGYSSNFRPERPIESEWWLQGHSGWFIATELKVTSTTEQSVPMRISND